MNASEIIQPAFTKAEVARRYYNELFGEFIYPNANEYRERARKRFFLDKNVNLDILKKVIKNICDEQRDIIKDVMLNSK